MATLGELIRQKARGNDLGNRDIRDRRSTKRAPNRVLVFDLNTRNAFFWNHVLPKVAESATSDAKSSLRDGRVRRGVPRHQNLTAPRI
jgi:hypothetical protein